MKTPEQITEEIMDSRLDHEGTGQYGPDLEMSTTFLYSLITAAIEADRAQRKVPIVLIDAAAKWCDELREYIIPASLETGDTESAESQMLEVEAIDKAVKEQTS